MKTMMIIITMMTILLFGVMLSAADMMNKTADMGKQQMEKEKPPVPETTFTGYLSDVLCGEAGMDPDENDLTKTPEKHTKACMMAESCVKSGYGIFIKNEEGMYKFVKFDEQGNQIVRDELLHKTEKEDGIMITVMGKMLKNGTIEVASIKENMLPKETEEMKAEMKNAEMEAQKPEMKPEKGIE